MKATYQVTTDKKIPAVVYKGDYSTLVWIQSEWTEGRYAGWVQRNGILKIRFLPDYIM